jgi:uncharacterized damage-inducible protein DinB
VQRAIVSEIARILDELQREHGGDPWHGASLCTILDGISASQAAARPVPAGHSIWELVLHITAWKNEVRRRLSGAAAGEPQEGDWPDVGKPDERRWRAALAALEDAQQKLTAAIRRMPERRLDAPTNDPRDSEAGVGVSYYVLLHGIVQHDVYHAGQIALLKRAVTSS